MSFFLARALRRTALTLAFALVSPMAWAQAATPFGFWSTEAGNETLYVGQDGCKFEAFNAQRQTVSLTSGRCSWNPSSGGGILTIMAVQLYKPAPIYFNIVWVDQDSISVYGDIFHRRAN